MAAAARGIGLALAVALAAFGWQGWCGGGVGGGRPQPGLGMRREALGVGEGGIWHSQALAGSGFPLGGAPTVATAQLWRCCALHLCASGIPRRLWRSRVKHTASVGDTCSIRGLSDRNGCPSGYLQRTLQVLGRICPVGAPNSFANGRRAAEAFATKASQWPRAERLLRSSCGAKGALVPSGGAELASEPKLHENRARSVCHCCLVRRGASTLQLNAAGLPNAELFAVLTCRATCRQEKVLS